MLHTRLCLDACASNYYSFKIGIVLSPKCSCGHSIETVNHYLLHCSRFATPRSKLLSAATRFLRHRCLTMTHENQIIDLFLLSSSNFSDELIAFVLFRSKLH